MKKVALALCVLLAASGCREAVLNLLETSKSELKIVNAAPILSPLRIGVDSVQTLYSGERLALNGGRPVFFEIFHPNDSIKKSLRTAFYTFAENRGYTMFVRGTTFSQIDFVRPIPDTLQSPFAGQAALRFCNFAEIADIEGDVVNSDGQSVLPYTVYSGDYTTLAPLTPGTASLRIVDAIANVAVAQIPEQSYQAGKTYTIYIFDKKNDDGTFSVQAHILE